jgi:hypothetical protein
MRIAGVILAGGLALLLAGCSSLGGHAPVPGHAYETRPFQNHSPREPHRTVESLPAYGDPVPYDAYQASNGRICVDYTQEIHVRGKRHVGVNTACQDRDGAWRPIWTAF